ncbi:MAG: tetratricopeptide repeat protein [Tannerella sp.]|jgi:tetratricopeptide (TPR) repeat protein|nr:tetratricopeptide repeat protein [Tannerella sp.]
MRNDEISLLWQRYVDAKRRGVEPYFDADEIEDLLEHFESLKEKKDFGYILNLGLRLHPGNQELIRRACNALMDEKRYEEALRLSNELTTESEDKEMIRMECYCSLHQYDCAEKRLAQLEKQQVSFLENVCEYLCALFSDASQWKRNLVLAAHCARLFPDNLDIRDEYCYALEKTGNYQEGILQCNEVLERFPYDTGFWYSLGRFHFLMGAFEEAIDAFDYGLACGSSDTTTEDIRILRAYCLFMNKNYEKAIEAYQEIQTGDDAVDLHIKMLVADSYCRLSRFEEAYQCLLEVINTPISDGDTYMTFVNCCMETGRESEASAALKKGLRLFPDNMGLLTYQALFYLDEGKEEEAVKIGIELFKKVKRLAGAGQDEESPAQMPRRFFRDIVEGDAQTAREPSSVEELIYQCINNKSNMN